MYGIFTYIWAIFGVNVGKYSIHGAYGYVYVTHIIYHITSIYCEEYIQFISFFYVNTIIKYTTYNIYISFL